MTGFDHLHEALNRATDGIDAPPMVGAALATARQRRVRRRGAAAAVLSSGLVAAVVVAVSVGGSTTVSPAPEPSLPVATVRPDVPQVVEQDIWDPRKVDDLPAAGPSIAPAIPDIIVAPESAPSIDDQPIEAAVLAIRRDRVVFVRDVDDTWASVALAKPFPQLALSPGGTRLVVFYGGDDGEGATVVDLGTGESRVLPFPADYQPFDGTSWTFVDEDTLLLAAGSSGWLVDSIDGTDSVVPHPVGYPAKILTAIDPSGALLTSADLSEPSVLIDYAGPKAREIGMERTGRLSYLHATRDTVVGTSHDDRPFSVVVADRESLTPRAVLPIKDTDANYSNYGLSVLAVADNSTVMLRVYAIGGGRRGFRVVAWDPDSGNLSQVSYDPIGIGVGHEVVFAEEFLRDIGDTEEAQDSRPTFP